MESSKQPECSHTTKRTGSAPFSRAELCAGDTLSELIHKLGHEVDNPLTAIISVASVIDRVPLQDQTGEAAAERISLYARCITKEAWRISALIDKLRLLASTRTTEANSVDVTQVLFASLAKVRDNDDYEALRVAIDTSPELPFVWIERDQFSSLMAELLGNAHDAAAKAPATGDQQIEIAVSLTEAMVKIEIRNRIDQAVGCPLDQLFQPFFSLSPDSQHVGLGLTVAAAICERFGGTLALAEIENDSGLWFVSKVTLQRAVAGEDRPEKPAAVTSLPPHLDILIIDDEPTVASAVKKVIEVGLAERTKVSCECMQGAQALQVISAGRRFDVILCDLNLRDMSGRFVLETLTKTVPELVDRFAFLTGDSSSGTTISYLKSCNCPYLLKPFHSDELLGLVTQLGAR